MDNTTHRYNQKCPECGGTDFVDDYAAGDFVCTVFICINFFKLKM